MAKVSEEILNEIKDLRTEQGSLQAEMGSLGITKQEIKEREAAIYAELKELGSKAQESMSKIREEYGDGSVDLESGEFTPADTAE
jgi:hypothetical protein